MDGLSMFDAAALLVLLASGVLALVRGFVRESLSIAAFVFAALAAIWSRPVFIGMAEDIAGPGLLANALVLGVVFLLVFLAVSFITNSLSRGVKTGDEVGVIDRTAGFAFGLLRGLVLLGLLLILFASATPGRYPPPWIAEARIYPLVNASARALQTLAPEGSRIADSPRLPPAGERDTEEETAYERRERERLEELLRSTTGRDDR
ncbi:MAG: CvpA family protein [Maricaulaceae bacterium]|nr:CvpA family protein [Maricaulaceae bacterium]